MRDIVRLGGRLLLITLVAGLLLAGVKWLTALPIERQQQDKGSVIRAQVIPGAKSFEQLDLLDLPDDAPGRVLGVYSAEQGYALEVEVTGFKGPVRLVVGISPEGTLLGVRIGEHGETVGLGSLIEDASFTDQFTGQPAEPEEIEISAISGATVSSRAALQGVQAASLYYRTHLAKGDGGL